MRILEEKKWAIFSVPEARNKSYGCPDCDSTIELAKRTHNAVLGFQTPSIAPKWEMVAVWNGSSGCATPLTKEDVEEYRKME